MTDEQQQPPDETPTPAATETPAEPAVAPEAAPSAPPFGAPFAPPAGGPMRPSGPRRKREFKGKYMPRRRVCAFCADKTARIDYKDVSRLRRFLSDRGKIEPRRKTGTCAKHQRVLSTALKRARFIALLPYSAEHVRIMGGPSLGRG